MMHFHRINGEQLMSADSAAITLSGGPVITPTRREEVAMRIWRALLAGELRPGQSIKEVYLAEALGVSRPTLREDELIRRLEQPQPPPERLTHPRLPLT